MSVPCVVRCGVLVGCVVLAPSLGQTQSRPTLAVLDLDATALPPEAAARLQTLLMRRVAETDTYAVRPGKPLDEVKLVFGCLNLEAACMSRLGKVLRVDKLLWGTVAPGQGYYRLTLWLLDVASARLEASVSETATLIDDLDRLLGELSHRILSPAEGEIRIAVDPSGATVRLDTGAEAIAEGAPLLFPGVPLGDQRIEVTKEGYAPWIRTVSVRPQQTLAISVRLVPLAAKPRQKQPPLLGVDTAREQTVPHAVDASAANRAGWRTAFWITSATTLAFLGAATGFWIARADLTGNKETEIGHLGEKHPEWIEPGHPLSGLFDPTKNACRIAADDPENRAATVADICSSANLYRGLGIGFSVAAGVSALTASYLFYKGYLERHAAGRATTQRTPQRVSSAHEAAQRFWLLSPIVSVTGGGATLRVVF